MASDRVTDIATRFHRACTGVRIPFRDRFRYWCYYIALAHRGVMVYSPTLDAQYEEGFLKRGYDKYRDKINRRLARSPEGARVLDAPSFAPHELDEDDYRLLMRLRIPFVLRGGAEGLPIHDWTLEYLEEVAGSCDVPINQAGDRPSEDRSLPTKGHHYYDFRTGKLSEVVESIRTGGVLRFAAAEDVMHHDQGRLRRDLDLGHWERVSGWERNQHHWLRSKFGVGKVTSAQLIMQPENAFTLLHAEPADNFFILAKGVKTWTLAHPLYTAAMIPRVKSTTNYAGSNIDVRESDDVLRERGFEAFLCVPRVRLQMGPGDVLRVPNYWWHTAETHPGHYALAVSIRAESGPNLVGPGYMILRRFDRQFDAMLKSMMKDGRIADRHIGFPRKSRSTQPTGSSRAP